MSKEKASYQLLKVKLSICLDPALVKWLTQEVKRRRTQGRNNSRSQIVNEALFRMAEKNV